MGGCTLDITGHWSDPLRRLPCLPLSQQAATAVVLTADHLHRGRVLPSPRHPSRMTLGEALGPAPGELPSQPSPFLAPRSPVLGKEPVKGTGQIGADPPMVDAGGGPADPRPAAHCGLPVACPRRRPGHRAGMDGARVDRDDEPLPAPPRHPRRPGRTGASQRSGARRGHTKGGGVRMTKEEPRPTSRVCAGQTGSPSGGAEGIRTPDLLIANETRYQLRHSPSMRTKL